MKSIALVSPDKAVMKLQEILVPDPKEHEVQIRVHTSVVSQGTERAFILNLENTSGKYPFIPGYCSAGVVEKIGKYVKKFKIGDRVACTLGHRSLGNIREQRVACIPDSVSYEQAAFLHMGIISLQGVRKLRIELGESAMILGLGQVGQLALQFAMLNGSLPCIGIDRNESKLKMAKENGADIVFNSSEDGWKENIEAITKGLGPDVVIECTGNPEAIELALNSVKKYGRVVLLGSTRGESSINFYKYVHRKAITIIGAHVLANPHLESRPGYWTWKDDADYFMKLLENKRIHLDSLITNRVTWEKAEEVYEQILSWNSSLVGIVIKWQ